MCDDVEVEVWMHGRQGCLVACVWAEPGTEKGVQTHQTQPDVAPEYRTHRMHRTQSPHYESQNATPLYLMQDGFLLMEVKRMRALGEQARDLREVKRRYMKETGECSHLEVPESIKEIAKNYGNTVREERRLGSSGDEDIVIGAVIVAGGASTKRKNKASWKKRKLLREEKKEKAEYYKGCVPL